MGQGGELFSRQPLASLPNLSRISSTVCRKRNLNSKGFFVQQGSARLSYTGLLQQ
jgi:hypothetical protein